MQITNLKIGALSVCHRAAANVSIWFQTVDTDAQVETFRSPGHPDVASRQNNSESTKSMLSLSQWRSFMCSFWYQAIKMIDYGVYLICFG